MKWKNRIPFVLIVTVLILNACTFSATPAPTATPAATNTVTATSTKAPTPTKTPFPTWTPNVAATQQSAKWNAEIQSYLDEGYINTTDGKIKKLDDFSEEWAQINWYTTWPLKDTPSDFVFSGHFKWSSASKTPNPSGCGLVFAIQEDGSDYSVFLDQAQVVYLKSKYGHGYRVGRTRGSGVIKFGNPAEADFTLIVNDHASFVIVNGDLIGEYTLGQSDPIEGNLGISILSGTNKDYGTRCEISDMHLWIPNK